MSSAPFDPGAAPPPPPATRTLSNVLRDALAKGEEIRMLVAKGLPDGSLSNPAAYMNVELEGQSVTIPKLAGAGLGGVGTGYAVYVLATSDFMLAVGTVADPGVVTGGGIIPVGGIIEWPTDSAPPGWLSLDGSSFSSITYPLLAGVLGTTTLPDYRRRVPVGRGSGFSAGMTDGQAEGSRGVVHHHHVSAGVSVSVGSVGDHQHGGAGDHNHSLSGGDFAYSIGGVASLGSGGSNRNLVSGNQPTSSNSGNHQHPAAGGHGHSASGSVDADTSGGGPSNGPSYIVTNFIIRAA